VSAPSAMSKLFNSELQQRISDVFTAALDLYGGVYRHDPHAPMDGHWAYRYLDSRRRTLGGGTSEIQRNLIAGRGLGLPRG
jgi:alkylation response protein AidB-like acyl-CoA dehydrogenase